MADGARGATPASRGAVHDETSDACAPAKAPRRSLTSVGRWSSSMNGAELPLRRCVRGGLRPTAFGNGALASARRGPRASGRTAECRPRAPLQSRRRAAGTFSGLPIGSAMERSRVRVGCLRRGVEASHSIEIRPLRRFEAGKEHTIRSGSGQCDAPAVPGAASPLAPGPAGHIYQAREIASAHFETDRGLAMTAPGFSPQSRT